jgi:Icc-related predicted phosphoesterase
MGTVPEIAEWNEWLGRQPHRRKVVIAGNHDWLFEREPALARNLMTNATYLEDSGVSVDGVRFWGSPWQPRFFRWAFNRERGAELREKWDQVPSGVDVLITHGPPKGTLDRTWHGEDVGCEELATAVARVRPRLHVFGHIHEAYGRVERDGTVFVNAASVDGREKLCHAPIVVDL